MQKIKASSGCSRQNGSLRAKSHHPCTRQSAQIFSRLSSWSTKTSPRCSSGVWHSLTHLSHPSCSCLTTAGHFAFPWHPSGTHLAQLYAVVSDDSMTISACVIRLADMVMQSVQVEHVPDTDRPNSFEVPIFWAPNSVTLLMVRSTDRDQRQTCYRYDHPAVSSSRSDSKLLPARWHATSLHASQLSLTCKQPEHAPLQRSCLLVSRLAACKQRLHVYSGSTVRAARRRSNMKNVGCQLVYLNTTDPEEAQDLRCWRWAPDGSAFVYANDVEIMIHYIASGKTITVYPDVGWYPVPCFSPAPCSRLLCCGQHTDPEDRRRNLTLAAFVTTQRPPEVSESEDLSIHGTARHVAWGSRGQVAIAFMDHLESGVLGLYTVADGPSLQPLHTLTTGAAVEDVMFSPDGSFLALLDMGSKVSYHASAPMLMVVPRNEVVVVHLPSLQERRFGSRKHSDNPDENKYGTPEHQGTYHIQWPGRAMLSWQGTTLLVYGPGKMSRQRLPNRHESMLTTENTSGKHVAMPSSRLDL